MRASQLSFLLYIISPNTSYNKKYVLKIVAFDNLPPIAKIKVVESDKNLFLYERKLDASLSFDKDAKFGGKIIEYEYRVENEAIIRKKESFRYYIFPQKGSYKITLRVLDSNQVWSEMEVIRYTVK